MSAEVRTASAGSQLRAARPDPGALEAFRERHAVEIHTILSHHSERWLEATLDLSRKLWGLLRLELHRPLGAATMVDAAVRLGVPIREAWQLWHAGRVEREAPRLVETARSGRISVEKLLAVAPHADAGREAFLLSFLPGASERSVRRWVRQERRRPVTLETGEVVRTQATRLSRDAETMLLDLRARLTQRRGEVVPLGAAVAEALREGLRWLGRTPGARQYRLVRLSPPRTAGALLAELGSGERAVLRVERPEWRIERTPGRRAAHGDGGADDLLARVEGALAGEGQLRASERPAAAEAVAEGIEQALATAGRSRFVQARGLLAMREWDLAPALGYRGVGEYAVAELGIGESTASELLRCARAMKRCHAVRKAFREGKVHWTKLRLMAPFLNGESEAGLLEAMQRCSVRELEDLARALRQAEVRGGAGGTVNPETEKGEEPDVSRGATGRPIELAMSHGDWVALDRFAAALEIRSRGDAEALEEALWIACCRLGPPAPLSGQYRITVYQQGELAWQPGITAEYATLGQREQRELAGRDVQVVDLTEELALLEAEELARVASLGGPVRCPSARRPSAAAAVPGAEAAPRMLRILPRAARAPEATHRTRRAVYLRDGGRCAALGCSSRFFLEVHHIVERCLGGGNAPENLFLLCAACHGRLHSLDWELARSVLDPGVPPAGERTLGSEHVRGTCPIEIRSDRPTSWIPDARAPSEPAGGARERVRAAARPLASSHSLAPCSRRGESLVDQARLGRRVAPGAAGEAL